MAGKATMEFGDGCNVRLVFTPKAKSAQQLTTGWLPLSGRRKVGDDYVPITTITVDVGRIREALQC